jgi:hypothetical protein
MTSDSSFKVSSCPLKNLNYVSWQDIKAEDWSLYVAPFWPAVLRSAVTWKGLTSLLRSGKLNNPCHN